MQNILPMDSKIVFLTLGVLLMVVHVVAGNRISDGDHPCGNKVHQGNRKDVRDYNEVLEKVLRLADDMKVIARKVLQKTSLWYTDTCVSYTSNSSFIEIDNDLLGSIVAFNNHTRTLQWMWSSMYDLRDLLEYVRSSEKIRRNEHNMFKQLKRLFGDLHRDWRDAACHISTGLVHEPTIKMYEPPEAIQQCSRELEHEFLRAHIVAKDVEKLVDLFSVIQCSSNQCKCTCL